MLRSISSLSNVFVSVVLFLTLALTVFTAWEHVELSTTPGGAGHPFGVEEAGRDYATKASYLASRRWILGCGAGLTVAIIFGLWTERVIIAWFASVTAIVLLLIRSFWIST